MFVRRCSHGARMSGVLHVITGLDSGGAQSMLARIVLAEHRSPAPRKQVVVSMMDDGLYGEALRDAGVAVHCLECRQGKPSLRALWALVEIVHSLDPDVVMTWLYHADLAGTLAAVLARGGARRVVWNLRCSNMDFARYDRMTRWIVRALAWGSRFPAIVVANSLSGRKHHASLGYRPKRWEYLPNGFDLGALRPDAGDRASVRSEWSLRDDDFAVGMVARVDPMKDYSTFFGAAEMLLAYGARCNFVLIGKDTDRLPIPESIRANTAALGERSDVNRLLRGLDVMVLASAFGEGFPNVVGEAMASGVPCVVTDVGDAAEVVGDTGIAVSPGFPEALAGAVRRLMGEAAEDFRDRQRRARERIAERYSLERVVAGYRAVWDDVAQNRLRRT